MNKNRYSFRFCYYFSSLFPQFVLSIALSFLMNLQYKHVDFKYKNFVDIIHKICSTFDNIFNLFSMRVITGALLISVTCLIIVRHDLDSVQNRYQDKEPLDCNKRFWVRLSYQINPGLGNMFLNLLLPIFSMFPSYGSVGVSVGVCLFVDLLMGIFFMHTSDVIPNPILFLIGYNVYTISKSSKFSNISSMCVFGKGRGRKYMRKYCGKKCVLIPFVKSSHSKFAVISQRKGDICNGK